MLRDTPSRLVSCENARNLALYREMGESEAGKRQKITDLLVEDIAVANEMPKPDEFSGLSRAVIQYSEAFTQIVDTAKARSLSDADWKLIEDLVDIDAFERVGVFLAPPAEVIDWNKYKSYITQYAGGTSWEGTLRHITEQPGRVILELEERNTRGGVTDVSNTVTIYEFNEAGKLRHLDVYVMPVATRNAE